jgi:ubiquinol-cytochrome c reductase cytochrome b subunit
MASLDQKEAAQKTEMKGFIGWIDARLPVVAAFEKHMIKYYAPKNFNFFYVF